MTTEMNTAATSQRIESALADLIGEGAIKTDLDGMLCVSLAPEKLVEACTVLRDVAGFETNTFVTARDHGVGQASRFEVLYQFLSIEHGDRLRLSVMTTGDEPEVDSIVSLWPGAAYAERECWDLLGVRFAGHDNLRRLLMPEGFDHHPLRKDFPHVGIEPDRLYRQWDEARRAEYAAEQAAKEAK